MHLQRWDEIWGFGCRHLSYFSSSPSASDSFRTNAAEGTKSSSWLSSHVSPHIRATHLINGALRVADLMVTNRLDNPRCIFFWMWYMQVEQAWSVTSGCPKIWQSSRFPMVQWGEVTGIAKAWCQAYLSDCERESWCKAWSLWHQNYNYWTIMVVFLLLDSPINFLLLLSSQLVTRNAEMRARNASDAPRVCSNEPSRRPLNCLSWDHESPTNIMKPTDYIDSYWLTVGSHTINWWSSELSLRLVSNLKSQKFILIHIDSYWFILIHIDSYWFILIHINIYNQAKETCFSFFCFRIRPFWSLAQALVSCEGALQALPRWKLDTNPGAPNARNGENRRSVALEASQDCAYIYIYIYLYRDT